MNWGNSNSSYMLMIKLSLLFILFTFSVFSQIAYGPFNPSNTGNNTSVGTQSWTNAGNVSTSNDVRSSNSGTLTTHYQTATNFGFAIPSPVNINGIRVSIEKRHNTNVVAQLNGWTTGLTKTISAGTQRCLFVVFAMENGDDTRDITAMTYGGQAMTQVAQNNIGTGNGAFCGRLEVWRLNEAGITAAVGTTISPTFTNAAGYSATEYCDQFASAVYQYVDQTTPVGATITSGINGSTTPLQLGSPLTVTEGGMAVNVGFVGNNGNFTAINSGYTERLDNNFFNASFNTTGATIQIGDKAITTNSTEQPTITFSTSINRHVMIGFHINRSPVVDNQVRIIKGGTITGNNLASTSVWPLNDGTTTYGGPANAWGTTWTLAEINATNFGVAISAQIGQGTAEIDHIAITVWATSTLPVELLDFSGVAFKNYNQLYWMTASEINNAYFEIQSSIDGIHFNPIGTVAGNGNSSIAHTYSFDDINPRGNETYYRLKQVDLNGDFEFSPVILLTKESSDEICIFPNPNEGAFQIYNLENKIGTIDIYSSELKLMKQVSINAEIDPIIHIEDLSDASYYLFIHEKTGTKIVKVFKATK